MRLLKISFVITLIIIAKNAVSQDLDPWAYGNLPVKMNSAAFAYAYIDGNVVSEPSSPLQDFDIISHRLAAAYLRTFNFWGKLGRVQLTVPFTYMQGDLKVRGRDTSGSRTGFDDFRFRIGFNIFGSPPLEPKNFGTYRQEAIIGASLVITIPTGLYYPERIVNLGTNRWGFKPEIGISLRIGSFFWETYGGVKFSTANSEYLSNKTLKQSPLYSIQMHISHTFKNNMRIALSGTYVNGGQTSVNGLKQNDYIKHLRGGVALSYSVNQFHSFGLQLNTNLTANTSLEFKSVSLIYNFTWF